MTQRLARYPGLTDARILTLALMLVFAITALPGSRAHAAQTASPVVGAMTNQLTFLWQSTGGPDPLVQPYGVGVDLDGNVWVADEQDRFQIIAPDGTYRETWGTSGAGDGEFTFFNSNAAYARAYGDVAFDAAGAIYVADTGNTRVQTFAPDRTFLLSWGSKGTGDGQFLTPSGIAVGPDGTVYVSDEGRSDIQRFDAEGQFLGTIGKAGSEEGQFRLPAGIAVGPDGDVWVADYSNQRIQRFSASGEFRDAWGQGGSGNGEFRNPNGVAVNELGQVFVADADNNRLQVFTSDGQSLAMIGSYGSKPGQFSNALGVAAGEDGIVYVTDRHSLQAFQLQS
jgi:tripartite motif-containing protein 71